MKNAKPKLSLWYVMPLYDCHRNLNEVLKLLISWSCTVKRREQQDVTTAGSRNMKEAASREGSSKQNEERRGDSKKPKAARGSTLWAW